MKGNHLRPGVSTHGGPRGWIFHIGLSTILLGLWMAWHPGSRVLASEVDPLVRTERFRGLAAELRCLVCQNQSLADSNADLAVDLRNEVVRLMREGFDDRQIKTHLVERYGDFVLYRPQWAAKNLLLWVGPFAMLLLGAGVVWSMTRRRGRAELQAATPTPVTLSAADRERIERLLRDD